jgi:hypothetical protein
VRINIQQRRAAAADVRRASPCLARGRGMPSRKVQHEGAGDYRFSRRHRTVGRVRGGTDSGGSANVADPRAGIDR